MASLAAGHAPGNVVRRGDDGIGRTGEKCLDLIGIFLGQYRAGRVQQRAAGAQHRPKIIQQLALQGGELADVVGASQFLDIRVAANDTGAGAGRVQQDGVKRRAAPPVALGSVGVLQIGSQAQPVQAVVDPPQALVVTINGGERDIELLQQMGGFAAGGAAGVQHVSAWRGASAGPSSAALSWAASS